MKKLVLSFLLISSPIHAETASDRVKLDISRAELQVLINGLFELPYKTAAPLLIELKKQLDNQNTAPAKSEPAAPGTQQHD
jgi:hypothetical protein